MMVKVMLIAVGECIDAPRKLILMELMPEEVSFPSAIENPSFMPWLWASQPFLVGQHGKQDTGLDGPLV